jgi:hypothetical protein
MQAAALDDAIRGLGLGPVEPEQDSEEDVEEAKESSKERKQAVCASVRPMLAFGGEREGTVVLLEEGDALREESKLGGWTYLAPTTEGLEIGQAALVNDEGVLCESL